MLTVSNGTVQPQPTVEVGSNVQDVDGDVIAAAGPQGQIYVAWQMQSNITAECAECMFSRSLDGGMTFSTPLNVSNDPTEIRSVSADVCRFNWHVESGLDNAWTLAKTMGR